MARSDIQTSALRRQMEQFFEATTDAIAFLDREYRFTFLNTRASELISQDRNLLGEIIFEAFPATGTADSLFLFHYTRTMEEGIPGDFEAYYPAPLNLWFRVQTYPAAEGIVLYFRDVSQEKRTQETLEAKTAETERQHAELKTIYDTAPIGLALFDLDDYHYLRLNDRQAAFFGLKPEEIVGKTLIQMAPIEGLRELFDQVRNGTPVINFPLEGVLVNNPEYRYWTVSYFPVYGTDGRIQAITAASLEITQQKKAEMALMQSEKLAAVGRLASSIAHEINNPLEAVTNLLYLAEHSETLEEARRFIMTAEVELRRASAITTQTLKFHKQASSPQAVNLHDLVESIVAVYQGRITNARVKVEIDWRPTRPVKCFEGEIRQVLSNLASNALDAMHGGGRLLFRGREGTDWKTRQPGVVITIADTGEGMSAETRRRLFDAFYTTKGMIGTGLGLWVSQEIVTRHRGVLRVRSSQKPGSRGTVFTLFLPFETLDATPTGPVM